MKEVRGRRASSINNQIKISLKNYERANQKNSYRQKNEEYDSIERIYGNGVKRWMALAKIR